MIIQINQEIENTQKESIVSKMEEIGYKTRPVKTQYGHYLIGVGKATFDIRELGKMEGVNDIHIVSDDYKLVSKKWKVRPTTIDLGDDVRIGNGSLTLMAGTCSIEGEKQIQDTLTHLKEKGIKIMRGGVFKPRSSPYAFRGMGLEGLKTWYSLARDGGVLERHSVVVAR